TEDGLFRAFAEVIERVGSDKTRIYLYNIPPVAQVAISTTLIERLKTRYPNAICGIKDSSGQWSNTQEVLSANFDDFEVFVGSETFLLQNMRNGGAGCISATANVNPAAIHDLFLRWQEPDADDLQAALNQVRAVFTKYPMIPALKSATAHFTNEDVWRNVRPPLVPLPEAHHRELISDLEKIGFSMPGVAG
ncbi:MAG: dihydrodipicolinate synthase family protein, partial [Rhodothermales bacterium]|nr:dihydrodipicolinate synthase family protein [Rhodothermales bacterium]